MDFVDISKPGEAARWARSLGVSESELTRAVEMVGPSIGRVYDYLGRARNGTAR